MFTKRLVLVKRSVKLTYNRPPFPSFTTQEVSKKTDYSQNSEEKGYSEKLSDHVILSKYSVVLYS